VPCECFGESQNKASELRKHVYVIEEMLYCSLRYLETSNHVLHREESWSHHSETESHRFTALEFQDRVLKLGTGSGRLRPDLYVSDHI
jgi:hypothetical protein